MNVLKQKEELTIVVCNNATVMAIVVVVKWGEIESFPLQKQLEDSNSSHWIQRRPQYVWSLLRRHYSASFSSNLSITKHRSALPVHFGQT